MALVRRLLLGALWVCGLVHGTAGAAWDVTGDVAEHQLLGAGNVPGVVEWNFLEGKPSDLGRTSIFWLLVWHMNFIFHFIYGMSSFPLTKSIIFQRGGEKPPTRF